MNSLIETGTSPLGDEIVAAMHRVGDFPRPGVNFINILFTMSQRPDLFGRTIDQLEAWVRDLGANAVAAIESRGFVFAAPVARDLKLPPIALRKPGKTPPPVTAIQYDLEYGTDRLELHEGAVRSGQRVVLIDDILATGGTAHAACSLIERSGGKVLGTLFVACIAALSGPELVQAWQPRWIAEF